MADSLNLGTTETSIIPPKFTVPKDVRVIANKREQQHQDLVKYVYGRLTDANNERQLKLRRYASIDRSISTWQKLKQADAERELLEEQTGRVTGSPVSLPLLATTLDDTVSFFSEIFAPQSRDFFVTPDGSEEGSKVWDLAKKMNQDTRFTGYYRQVTRSLRALLKYNFGGMSVEWVPGSFNSLNRNEYRAVDAYNVAWDSAVHDPTEVARRAEWLAQYDVMTRRELIQGLRDELFIQERIDRVFGGRPDSIGGEQRLYVRPPNHAGLSVDGFGMHGGNPGEGSTAGGGQGVDWGNYGLDHTNGLQGFGVPLHAFERHTMWIWLDPTEFGLASRETKRYELWQLTIVEGIVVRASPVVDSELEEKDEVIPVFLSPYTDDDMGDAQRSVMEYMRGFQRFASFLMNIWVLSARKSVYGITYYDRDMFNPAAVKEGAVAGYYPIRTSGRDIRTAIYKDPTGGAADANVINMLTSVLNLTKEFFPNQALPAQVAGIERAVKDQVSAVMAGGQARLRMQARLVDTNLFLPTRKQGVRNYTRNQDTTFAGIKDEEVSAMLGGGLKSLSAERAASILRELLSFLGTAQDVIPGFDLKAMLDTFSETLNLDFRLGDFVQQQQPQQQPGAQQAPGQPGAQPADSAAAPTTQAPGQGVA